MRKKLLQSWVFVIVLSISSCNSPPVKTYVNQDNTSEKLTLKSSSSVYWGLFNATNEEMKGSTGTYTLETPSGTSSGTYTLAVRDNRKPGYVFQPKDGKPWGVELDADSSFKDERGVWKLKNVPVKGGV